MSCSLATGSGGTAKDPYGIIDCKCFKEGENKTNHLKCMFYCILFRYWHRRIYNHFGKWICFCTLFVFTVVNMNLNIVVDICTFLAPLYNRGHRNTFFCRSVYSACPFTSSHAHWMKHIHNDWMSEGDFSSSIDFWITTNQALNQCKGMKAATWKGRWGKRRPISLLYTNQLLSTVQ